MRTIPLVIASVLLPLLAAPARAADRDVDLTGEWNHKAEFQEVGIVLLPDARYVAQAKIGDQTITEIGTFKVRKGTLTLTPNEGPARPYKIVVDGESLTLTDADGIAMAYARRPGSAKEVVAEAARVDEQKLRVDAGWMERFPIGKQTPGKNAAVGDVPEDTTPDNVLPGATVFQHLETYVKYRSLNTRYTVVRGEDPGNGIAQTRYYFFPSGRFLYINIAYTPTAAAGAVAHPATVEVTKAWGKYKIDSVPKPRPGDRPGDKPDPASVTETVTLVTDKGETIPMRLIDGRRNLEWAAADKVDTSTTIYSNVTWSNESLKAEKDRK
ncbi:MAG TPA: hypothetical protein VEA69_05000 [Tepidisphaeraceae bacterium]|nr:hypothetical protein [Tepidisphaeraceae bacterium]